MVCGEAIHNLTSSISFSPRLDNKTFRGNVGGKIRTTQYREAKTIWLRVAMNHPGG